MRKIINFAILIISIILLVSFSIPVSAVATGTIIINNAITGQTYTTYRLFDLESYNESTGSYSYKVATKWESFFKAANNTGALTYVTVDDHGYVTWNPAASTTEHYISFTRRANDYAKSEGIVNDGQMIAASATVCFNNLPLGYYLIDTTVGALCALNTTNPTATVEEKNIAPTVQKLTREGGQYKTSNDANIGDTVDFQTTITAYKGAENYVLHDKMDSGLQWNQGVTVTLNDNSVNSSNYILRTPSTSTAACEGCTFDVVFEPVFWNGLKANDKIVVSYSAYLLPSAVIGSTGNKNSTWLSYGDSNKTLTSTTTTYTWETSVLKYYNKLIEGNTVETPLANAKFRLFKNSTLVNLVRDTTDTNLYCVCTKSNCGSTHSHITEITTDSTGIFKIRGLDSGTYQLEETVAPAGFNKLNSPIQITINSSGRINATTESPEGVSQIKVLNKTGSILPQTGGTGTAIFYVCGCLLILAAISIIIVIYRKKHYNIENE